VVKNGDSMKQKIEPLIENEVRWTGPGRLGSLPASGCIIEFPVKWDSPAVSEPVQPSKRHPLTETSQSSQQEISKIRNNKWNKEL